MIYAVAGLLLIAVGMRQFRPRDGVRTNLDVAIGLARRLLGAGLVYVGLNCLLVGLAELLLAVIGPWLRFSL